MLSFQDSPNTLGNGNTYDITVEKVPSSLHKGNGKVTPDFVFHSNIAFPSKESDSPQSMITVFDIVPSTLPSCTFSLP